MIARPGHAIDADQAPTASLPTGYDVDLHAAGARVVAWGGNATRFADSLGRGVAAVPDLAPAEIVTLGAVAGWRAGVLGLRDDALARMASATGPLAMACAAALRLRPDELASTVAGQRQDRFWWPGATSRSVVARVGGFRGLGGPWDLPPRDPQPIAAGAWTVRVGDARIAIEADVFGHRVAGHDEHRSASDDPGWADLEAPGGTHLATIRRSR
ncbi:potassium transporter Kef [Microbacterium sp.]|uniref:potassium transporter Kef n=1 Tax=Microbacterium sp. TaxID=51671 RepID=UPI002810BFC8|nr:potassium transporter Kef [Microbacterium sp.]